MKNYLVMGTVLALSSCTNLGVGDFGLEEVEQNSKYAAASIDIAAFAPIPWSLVVEDLKPNFNLQNARGLLDDVAPLVGGDDARLSRLSAFDASLQITGGVMDSSRTNTASNETNSAGENTQTSSVENRQTVTRSTPEAQSVEQTLRESNIPALALNAAPSNIDFDPELQYRSATALFQSIQLLDRYLDSGIVDEGRENAYLIRTQITVTPYARQQPYDTYVNLSVSSEATSELFKRDNGSQIRIFPLIISDNLERVSTRRIAETIQDIQSSIGARGGPFSFGAGYRRAIEQLRSLVGTDLNNLVTYAQPEDNELQIRLSAAFDPRSGYAMRARTYDVTFVAIFPDLQSGEEGGGVFADINLRHARTGELLPSISSEDIDQLAEQLSDILNTYGCLGSADRISNSDECDMKYFSDVTPEKAVEMILSDEDALYQISLLLRDGRAPSMSLMRALRRAFYAPRNEYSRLGKFPRFENTPTLQTPSYVDNGSVLTATLVEPTAPSLETIRASLYYVEDVARAGRALSNLPIMTMHDEYSRYFHKMEPPSDTYTPSCSDVTNKHFVIHERARTNGSLVTRESRLKSLSCLGNANLKGPYLLRQASYSGRNLTLQFPSFRAFGHNLNTGRVLLALSYARDAEAEGPVSYFDVERFRPILPDATATITATNITQRFIPGTNGNPAKARISIDRISGLSQPPSVTKYRITLDRSAPVNSVERLQDNGQRISPTPSPGSAQHVNFLAGRNAFEIQTLGLFEISLVGATAPTSAVSFTVQGIDASNNVVEGEAVPGSFSAN